LVVHAINAIRASETTPGDIASFKTPAGDNLNLLSIRQLPDESLGFGVRSGCDAKVNWSFHVSFQST
jgi:hypothetical protein